METIIILTLLLIVTLIIIIILSIVIYQKSTNAICVSRKRLEGKTVIVTGGTAGMGLLIATDFAHRGARVIIACPFEEEGITARNQIIKETGNGDVIFMFLDQSSLESTRKFAADILNTEDRLDILLNNAGIGFPSDFLTKDGLSFIMQVNYYGPVLLTLLLLPLLRKTGKRDDPSRILVTTSVLHMLGQVDIKYANKMNYWYSSIQVYGNSKISLIYFAKELTKKLRGSDVVINCVDPGAVGTRIFNSINIVVGTFISIGCLVLFKTPWFGAQTALYASLDKGAGEVSGAYFKNCEINRPVKRAYCNKTSKLLWNETVRAVKISEDDLNHILKHA